MHITNNAAFAMDEATERMQVGEMIAADNFCDYEFDQTALRGVVAGLQTSDEDYTISHLYGASAGMSHTIKRMTESEVTAWCVLMGKRAIRYGVLPIEALPTKWKRPDDEKYISYEGSEGGWHWSIDADPFEETVTTYLTTRKSDNVELGFVCSYPSLALQALIFLPEDFEEPGQIVDLAIDGTPREMLEFDRVFVTTSGKWALGLDTARSVAGFLDTIASSSRQATFRLDTGKVLPFDADKAAVGASHLATSCLNYAPNSTTASSPNAAFDGFTSQVCKFTMERLALTPDQNNATIGTGQAERTETGLRLDGAWLTSPAEVEEEFSINLLFESNLLRAAFSVGHLFPNPDKHLAKAVTLEQPQPSPESSLEAHPINFEIDHHWSGKISFSECV